MSSRNLSLNFGLPPGSNRILINYWLVLAKRLSEKEKIEIVESFTKGKAEDELAKKFNCTKLTISRNLKKTLGEKMDTDNYILW